MPWQRAAPKPVYPVPRIKRDSTMWAGMEKLYKAPGYRGRIQYMTAMGLHNRELAQPDLNSHGQHGKSEFATIYAKLTDEGVAWCKTYLKS